MKSLLQKGLIIMMPFIILGCQIPFLDDGKIPRDDDGKGSIDSGTGSEIDTGINTGTPVTYDDIVYNGTPKLLDTASVIGGKEDEIVKAYNEMNGGVQPTPSYKWSDIAYFFNFYDVGTIKAEQYKDWKLLVLDLTCDGMCFAHSIYRFAWNNQTDELVLLTKMSNEYTPAYFGVFKTGEDSTTVLNGQLPDKIQISETTKYITLVEKDYSYIFKTQEHTLEDLGEVVFTDQTLGDVYFMKGTGCLQVVGPDGAIGRYVYDPGFFEGKKVWIEWKDGSPKTNMTDEYTYRSGGCGLSGSCYLIERFDEINLNLVGTTSTGFDMYEVKNPIEEYSDSDGKKKAGVTEEQVVLSQAYLNYKSYAQYEAKEFGKKILGFEEFLATKPLLFWKDPFNRWSAIMNNAIKPPAECGKPVIYLYPQKETDVSVKVDIDEFTATVPDYGTDGWKVRAYPNGKILNYADGKTYPYLFWEGKDSDTVNVTKGFVVERDNLKKFLKKSLKEMGLKGNEKAEFMDFWLPRMMENTQPYFFVSFLGTQDFNKIAPLEITPKPDTLIRIFMYFEPLNTKIKVAEQDLKSVKRKGFTVVEWGGTSNTSWKY